METNNVVSKIWRYLRHYKVSLFTSFFMMLVSVLMPVIEPFMLGLAITELTSNLVDMARGVEGAGINYNYIFWILVLYSLRGLVNQFTTFGSNYFITVAVQNMVRDLRNDIIHKINLIPVSYYDRNQFGNILGRITSDVESVSNALQQSLLQIVNAILSIIFVAVMMLWLNWKLALEIGRASCRERV